MSEYRFCIKRRGRILQTRSIKAVTNIDKKSGADHCRDVMLWKWSKKMQQEELCTGGGDVEATELDQLMLDIEDDKARALLDLYCTVLYCVGKLVYRSPRVLLTLTYLT